MARIFVSFVGEDRAVAEALKNYIEYELELTGKREFFMMTDPKNLKPGDDWLKVLHDALKDARVVLAMLSRRAIGTPWVNFESGAGWLNGKRVIPVCFG